jgi:hypothetical protein
MDSAVDAVMAGVFMLASQMLTLLISPSMALPGFYTEARSSAFH